MATPRLSQRKHKLIHELGAAGKSHRQIMREAKVSMGTVVNKLREPIEQPAKACLPPSWAEDYPPFRIDTTRRALLLFDVHIPFHIEPAIRAAVEAGKREGVDTVILGGDALDFHTISRYDHDGSKLTYQQEIEYGRQFMAYLREQFPKARIIFKEGNHEERLNKYILGRAPALFGLENCTLASLISLHNVGAELVTDQRVIHLGKLRIIHGHEYGGGVSAPVNAARWLMNKAKRSAVMGHLHETSAQPDRDIDGELRMTWSVGCLCGLNPKYRRLNTRWNHGFATVEVSRGGDFEMRNRHIVDGKPL